MEVKRAVVRSADVGRMVVNASVPRSRLRRTHFAKYVAYAEREGWHTGSTIASRARTRPWYDLNLRAKARTLRYVLANGTTISACRSS